MIADCISKGLRRALPVAIITAAAMSVAASSQILPTEKKGVSNVESARIDLPQGLLTAKARSLRMRKVTILPGGALPMHSHADRPSVSYVLSGTLTEYVAGQTEPHELTAGQANTSFAHDHALLNKGKDAVIFLEVDLPASS